MTEIYVSLKIGGTMNSKRKLMNDIKSKVEEEEKYDKKDGGRNRKIIQSMIVKKISRKLKFWNESICFL